MNKFLGAGCVLAIGLCPAFMAEAAIVPVYQQTATDATWTEVGSSGVYTVATSAEDYGNEVWERPVKDNEWSDSGGTRTSSNLYYAYIDLASAGWGVGTNADDGMDYLFVNWAVVGAFQQEPGKSAESKLLEGHYYFYAEPAGKKAFAVEVKLAKDIVGSDYGASGGKINVLFEKTEGDVPGTGIDTTEEGGDGFQDIAEAGVGYTDSGTFTTHVAIKLSDLGLTLSDFDDPVDYAYAGAAVSNPSAPSDLFANDHFSESIGSGQEYDTVKLGNLVPEPASLTLLGAMAGMFFRRPVRRRG